MAKINVSSVLSRPVKGGTRVMVIAEAQPGGLFKLVGPVLMRLRKRQFKSDLANVKAMIEASAF